MSFDLTVHIRDKKGNLIGKQPYKMQIKDGKTRFERPVGSGIWHAPNGEVVDSPEMKEQEAQLKAEAAKLRMEVATKKVEPEVKPEVVVETAKPVKAKEVKDGGKA